MKTSKILLFCLGLVAFLGSCTKEGNGVSPSSSSGGSSYSVKMTDAPGPYRAVYVDIQSVEVVTSNGNTQTLETHRGIYNLLRFSNGVDTMVASGLVNASSVEQIRLILGPNNSVITSDGVLHHLSTPSAQQSGLKIQVHHMLQTGSGYTALLDFDAHESIVVSGSSYSLKPVIRTVESSSSGTISGSVSVSGALTLVTAKSGSFSFSSIANANGEFMIAGVPPGDYTLFINPVAPYSASTRTVHVSAGSTTQIGIVSI